MADLQNGPTDIGFVDKRRGRHYEGVAIAEANNMDTVGELKARLTALNATSYSAARLASMTVNDMVYALRVASGDAAGI